MRLSIGYLVNYYYDNEFGILIQHQRVHFPVAAATLNGFGHSIVLYINISSLYSIISLNSLHWFLILSIILFLLSLLSAELNQNHPTSGRKYCM